jgi:hypothetical protein
MSTDASTPASSVSPCMASGACRRYNQKVVVITGSTAGIGLAIAERMGLEGASSAMFSIFCLQTLAKLAQLSTLPFVYLLFASMQLLPRHFCHQRASCSRSSSSRWQVPSACSHSLHSLHAMVTGRSRRIRVHAVVVSSRSQENVDAAVSQLQDLGIDCIGTVCHVGNAEDRSKLVKTAVEVRLRCATSEESYARAPRVLCSRCNHDATSGWPSSHAQYAHT